MYQLRIYMILSGIVVVVRVTVIVRIFVLEIGLGRTGARGSVP